jgi:methionyl-tRNA formyltransferase
MRIVLLCATARGLAVLDTLALLARGDTLTVASFREEPIEPPFLEAIRERAAAFGARFHETRTIGTVASVWSEPVDLLLAVSWRYFVPSAVYRRVRLGAFVIHDSLLPRYRGFSPTVWAVANGEPETGATLFHMSETIDAGDIVDQRRVPIGPEDRIGTVMNRVTEAYLDLMRANFPALRAGTAPRRPQDESLATVARRRTPEDNRIDWSMPTRTVYNLIRAVTRPYRGAYTYFGPRRVVIWDAEPAGGLPAGAPGSVGYTADGRVSVTTGNGQLLLLEVEIDGEPTGSTPEAFVPVSGRRFTGEPAAP